MHKGNGYSANNEWCPVKYSKLRLLGNLLGLFFYQESHRIKEISLHTNIEFFSLVGKKNTFSTVP